MPGQSKLYQDIPYTHLKTPNKIKYLYHKTKQNIITPNLKINYKSISFFYYYYKFLLYYIPTNLQCYSIGGCKDSSVVNSSYSGPWFGSQLPHDSLQPPETVTPVLGNPMPSSDLFRYQSHIHTFMQNT